MSVPTAITDLSTTAGSNSPTGTETPKEGDNHLRAAYSFIAQLRDKLNGTDSTTAVITALAATLINVATLNVSGTATVGGTLGAVDLTTTGNTILGNASTDTLNVGNGGIVKDASGNVLLGLGATATDAFVARNSSSSLAGFYRAVDVTSVGAAGMSLSMGALSGSTQTAAASLVASLDNPATTGALSFYTRVGGALTEKLRISSAGVVDLLAGSGSLRMNGAVTRQEVTGTLALNTAFSNAVSRVPDSVEVWLECLTTEAGYAVGQYVRWPESRVGFTGGHWVQTNAAGTSLTLTTHAATVQIPNTAGVATNITPANWRIRIRMLFL